MSASSVISLPYLGTIFGLAVLGTLITVIRRIYFSPIAHIPGPKLAAATLWYEFYYDIILGGKYLFHIEALHEKYGPVIRINPYEIHIKSSNFYDEIYASYASGRKRDKWDWTVKAMSVPESTFATTSHDHHRLRRSALNPFFSKASVRSLQPFLDAKVDQLLDRLQEFKKTGNVMRIDHAFVAFANDVVSEYSFGTCDDRLGAHDFQPDFYDRVHNGMTAAHATKHLSWIPQIIQAMPEWLSTRLVPEYGGYLAEQKIISDQAVKVLKSSQVSSQGPSSRTIFHEIIDSKLPLHEKSLTRLSKEAMTVIGAGTLTTAWTLSVAICFLLSNPATLKKLRDELRTSLPEPSVQPSLAALEKLPYLRAVIEESLRLSYGAPGRLHRIATDETIVFDDGTNAYQIPPGTPCSMSFYFLAQDESIFPDAQTFHPERWVENPRLDRYQVVFSKGTRSCLGINLAYAELYLMLAGLFRHYGSPECSQPGDRGELVLFETSTKDVELDADFGIPCPPKESKGIRIRVVS